MKKLVVLISAVVLVAMGGVAWAVDGGSGGLGHNWASTKGTCAKCHIPHGGKGDKIWAVDLGTVTSFTGVHQLCNSCHYTGGFGGATSSGNTNVFSAGAFQNHSMLGWANTIAAGITIPAGFALNTTDTDTIWTVADPDTPANGASRGFYCGTCHNPHKQPVVTALQVSGNGDYLRVAGAQTLAQFGASGARLGACTQCHTTIFTVGGLSTGHDGNCMVCHSPHKGVTVATAANADIAEKILIQPVTGANVFTALPNVPAFTAGTYSEFIAAICYGCHSTGAGSTRPINAALEHHQMSSQATLGATGHAPGTLITDNNYQGANISFTCTNCHDMHDSTQDLYLKTPAKLGGTYAFPDDSAFCTSRCHTGKAFANLGSADNEGHRFTVAGSSNSNGGCYMCHFIHDGSTRGAAARADITAMMREVPVDYIAGTNVAANGVGDYEDMCYGCHSSAVLTRGNAAGVGATLNGAYFSHRFNGAASVDVKSRMDLAPVLPYATATTTGGGDYGAPTTGMYCGTCHNVHVQNATDREGNLFRTPNNTGAGALALLCVKCHSASGMSAGTTHPTYLNAGYDTDLPSTRTTANVPAAFGNGGSGTPGGRTGAFLTFGGAADATGNMSCETCHNFHTANTDLFGNTTGSGVAGNKGKLLVRDNLSTATGSDMCVLCHGASY